MLRLAPLLAIAVTACVSPGRAPLLANPIRPRPATPLLVERQQRQEPRDRARVVQKARDLLAGAPLEAGGYRFEPDPVGFVRAAFWSVGIDLFAAAPADAVADGMARLFGAAAASRALFDGAPQPGDLVFFDERPDHEAPVPAGVAVVETVGADGTVSAIGAFAGGPKRVALNLEQAEKENGDDGTRLNDVLVGDHRASAARLWRSYADPF